MALLNLTNYTLPPVNLLNQLVLEMNDATLKLFKFKPILSLHFLLGDIKHLCEVALQNLHVLTLLPHYPLQSIFTRSEPLFQLIYLVFKVVSLLGNFI